MKYVLVIHDNDLDCCLYDDLAKVKDVTSYYLDGYHGNSIKDRLCRIHTSLLINSYMDLPFKCVYYSKLFEYAEDNTCYIFSHISSAKIGRNLLQRLHSLGKNIRIALLLLDSFSAHSITLFRTWRAVKNVEWDYILSYDIEDCKRYGFTYLGYTYYSKNEDVKPSGIFSDIYFVGANKSGDNRYELVSNVFKYLRNKQVDARFIVVDKFQKRTSDDKEHLIFHQEYIPYAEVLSDVLSSNCVLEVLQDGQQQQSARYFEAVCYNKKLLTNNPHIVDLPFYDARYMRYFSKPEDIDVEWVMMKENIDYHYAGEFSPARIIDKLDELLAYKG